MAELQKNFSSIHFFDRHYLELLIIVAALGCAWIIAYVFWRLRKPKKTRLSRYPAFPKMKFWLAAAMVAALVAIALARPIRDNSQGKLKPGSIDIISAIDRSLSMAAEDVFPTRLEVARRENLVLAEKIIQPGDRVGLFIFGKDSFRKLYLSSDIGRFAREINKLGFPVNVKRDEALWDTDLAINLEHILQSLDLQDSYDGFAKRGPGGAKRKRIVLLFTDGDDRDLENEKLRLAAIEFKKRGIRIYAVGIGTKRGYSLLSLLKKGRTRGLDYDEYMEDEWRGKLTRLETKALEYAAYTTGGKVYTIENENQTARTFLKNAIDSEREYFFVQKKDGVKTSEELWRYAVIAGLILFMIAILFY